MPSKRAQKEKDRHDRGLHEEVLSTHCPTCKASKSSTTPDAATTLQPDDRIAFDFIDPLFAIVIHISFVEGIMKQDWFDDPSLIVESWPHAFELFVLGLAYVFVILSWVGYHISIIHYPLKPDTLPGLLRFGIDVLLLFLYWLLLLKFEQPQFEVLLLAVIFVLFIPWDILKRFEWPERDNPKRRGVTILWAGLFVVLALIYWFGFSRDADLRSVDWIVVAVAAVMVVGYRIHKERPVLKTILEFFASPKPKQA